MGEGAKLGTNKLSSSSYAGTTWRAISGDVDRNQRTEMFGTTRRYYVGGEAGVLMQIGNVL